MLHYCTLFNSAYLSRGLAMYYSLEDHCNDFHLYIFAFDNDCLTVLLNLKLKHATIISLKEFEDDELLAVKPGRTSGEYCWTCTSSTIWYCLKTYALDHCTYIDADLLFFSNPKGIMDEMNEKSILITAHRYTAEHDQSALSGYYCVQYITFKNTAEGLTALNWWRNACLEWCYKRFEDGKFGDQKYLDDWTTRFKGVHELANIGAGVAPWNVQQYDLLHKANKIQVLDTTFLKEDELIFYHFHDFRYCIKKSFRLTAEQYYLSKAVIKDIYKPYIKALVAAENKIRTINKEITFHEPLLNFDWIKRVTGRRVTFIFKGYYRNYYKKRKLI
ncbi:hypothetical protein [Arcticibacter svalbardensis]|uniref:hypothetical protein n=1 Tax=Arcticibacter svalbardensis TaxID=1288027 RepID=UPI00058E656D|nr:hypothetical protein [Arcticibacter svalbardensis]